MDEAVLARTMIIHFQAVLNTPLDPAARTVVLQLLAQAEAELSRLRDARNRLAQRGPRFYRRPTAST